MKSLKSCLWVVAMFILVVSCGTTTVSPNISDPQGTPGIETPFVAEPLAIRSYRLVSKFSSLKGANRLFHEIGVDRGVTATYSIRYKNVAFLSDTTVFNEIRCGDNSVCEVWEKMVDGSFQKISWSLQVTVSDNGNLRTIEVEDPVYHDLANASRTSVQATASGTQGLELETTIVRQ